MPVTLRSVRFVAVPHPTTTNERIYFFNLTRTITYNVKLEMDNKSIDEFIDRYHEKIDVLFVCKY